MSTTVYLVRHAEAEGNIGRRCHGIYNSMLTGRGREQAKVVGDRFRTIHLDAVYSSDLTRARDTARAIAQPHGLPVIERPLLREIDMGDWEDRPWADLAKFDKEPYDIWCNQPWNSQPVGGETIMQAGQRAFDEIGRIAKENDGKYIAVVSHGTVIRGILTLACGLKPEQMMEVGWGDNTCVARLVYLDDGSIRVDYRNDNSHLPWELSTFYSLKWSSSVDVPISPQLWFRPVDFDNPEDHRLEMELFHAIYWPAYGEDAFTDDEIEQRLRGYQAVTPDAVSFGVYEDDVVGVIAMAATDDPDSDVGEMGGTGILPQYRGWGFAPQLMNQAVSVYRRLGKTRLRSHPSAVGKHGPRFYRQNDFVEVGKTEDEKFLIMERKITADD